MVNGLIKMSELTYIYILETRDSTDKFGVYVGVTNNLEKRFWQHSRGIGGKYTKGRLIVKMLFNCQVSCRSNALLLEKILKKPIHKRLRYMLIGETIWTTKMKYRWIEYKEKYGVNYEKICN